jgi:hypothetical protein
VGGRHGASGLQALAVSLKKTEIKTGFPVTISYSIQSNQLSIIINQLLGFSYKK